jgi:predicted AAA+ superfamily ATPase
MSYRERKIQGSILANLESPDVLAILGPRRVGKTTLLKMLHQEIRQRYTDRKATLFFDLTEPDQLTALNRDPRCFKEYCLFSGADPAKDLIVMVDEIQNLQNPSLFLNHVSGALPSIKLIVAGATTFSTRPFGKQMPATKAIFQLSPLDFDEFLLFKGREDLYDRRRGYHFKHFIDDKPGIDPAGAASIQSEMRMLFEEFILFGGYPKVVLSRSREEKIKRLREVMEAFELKSVNVFFNIANFAAFRSFFKSMAGSTGELLNVNALSRNMRIGRDTVRRYLAVLENAFMLKTLRPFHNNHSKELTKKPKCYFGDTGLRNYAIGNFTELRFRPDKDQLFENTIYCELAKNIGSGDQLFFWRTISRNEIDFVTAGRHHFAFDVAAMPNAQLKRSSGFRAFSKLYPEFNRFVINFEEFSCRDGITYLPGWMV